MLFLQIPPEQIELSLSPELSELIARFTFFVFFHLTALTFAVLLSSFRR